MAKHKPEFKDEHYDLVSVLYHALQGDDTLTQYIKDAEKADDQELVEHFSDFQERYREMARESKELLKERLISEETDEEEDEGEDDADDDD
jgi:hypothetical protein